MRGEKMNKIEKALEACEKVIDGIEDSTITIMVS